MRDALLRDERAAQIVEFAIALPVLLIFVVGIFDFSGAFTLKQKLTNAARDSARTAAADPANDLASSSSLPASVADAYQVVFQYLQANKINTCGLPTTPGGSPTKLTWTFTANTNGCLPAGITLTINRGYVFQATGGAALPTASCQPTGTPSGLMVVGTCVSIQYPYPWTFGRAASILGTTTLPSTLSATAVAMNEN